jgi:hypothetical protein
MFLFIFFKFLLKGRGKCSKCFYIFYYVFLVCCDVSFYWKAICDIHLLMGLACVLPLVETIQFLLKFAKKNDTFICKFIIVMKVYKGQLYTLYCDITLEGKGDEFMSFHGLLQYDALPSSLIDSNVGLK